MKNFLILILTIFTTSLFALECSQCGIEIRRNYLTYEDKVFCSQDCFNEILPKCSVCFEPCVNEYFYLDNQYFCSRECIGKVYFCSLCKEGIASESMFYENLEGKVNQFCMTCSNLPKCHFCYQPTNRGKNFQDKSICLNCEKNGIKDRDKLYKIFQKVRNDLKKFYKYDNLHTIELIPITPQKMDELTKNISYTDERGAMGLYYASYSYEYKKNSQNKTKKVLIVKDCKIYIIENMPLPLLYETLAHELTHDYVRHKFGVIDDIADEEGICELVSSLYNEYLKQGHLNKRKADRKDPVYGAGYRKMRTLYSQTQSLSAVFKTLKK